MNMHSSHVPKAVRYGPTLDGPGNGPAMGLRAGEDLCRGLDGKLGMEP